MLTKKVTIITGNYFPEDTAIGLYTTQFANYLKNKGYSVNVITNFPYYPQWKIREDYTSKPSFYNETISQINIYRYKQYIPSKVTFVGRILLMLSFLYGAIINSKKIKETDLVICIIPFTLSLIPGFLLKKRCRAKLWVHVQDFEFDLAFESGVLKKNNFIIKIFKNLLFSFESYLLNKASVISSISNSMMAVARMKSETKDVFFFPNWVSSKNIDSSTSQPHSYITQQKFSLLYSGNVGEKQDWLLLEKLCSLIQTDDNIEIIIVGEGAYLSTLKEKISHNIFVRFFPLVPYSELSNLLCSADAHFLFQKTDVKDSIMPSKILGMMASEKPSIITGNKNSEVALIFNNNPVGFYYSDNNAETVLETITKLKNDLTLRKEIGLNARNYVINHFSEEVILEDFENKIRHELSKN